MPAPGINHLDLKSFLDDKVDHYNRSSFIEVDPISIPHLFTRKQDIEIAGLFASVIAWGQRTTIIRNAGDLMKRMDMTPYDFVCNHSLRDLGQLDGFKHRTFNNTDLLYFIAFLKAHYSKSTTLEDLFAVTDQETTVEAGLNNFHNKFFSLPDFPARTRKHIPAPDRKSACKRINMFLRWMVRSDKRGVDFGIWKQISPRQLVCPCDLHVERVARKLGLIRSRQLNWQTALELTSRLRTFDPKDPVKYDFALFGLGIEEKF